MIKNVRRLGMHSSLWFALILAICNALAPAALRVAAVARGEPVVQICSAFGINRAPPAQRDQGSGHRTADGWHCKFCLGSQAASAPLDATGSGSTPHTYAAWHFTQPRDPFVTNPARAQTRPRPPPALA